MIFGRKVFGAFFLNESCNTYYQCSQKYLQFHKKELVIWHCKGLYCIKLRHLRHCKISIVMMLCFCCLLNLFWWLILDVCYFVYPSLKCDTFSSVGFIRQFYSKRLNCSFFKKLEKLSDFSNRKCFH